MKAALVALLAALTVSPSYQVTFQEGADTSEALVCQRTSPTQLTCGDLRTFMRLVERIRKTQEAEAKAREEFKERLERHEVEL
jgi:hypothetical protein